MAQPQPISPQPYGQQPYGQQPYGQPRTLAPPPGVTGGEDNRRSDKSLQDFYGGAVQRGNLDKVDGASIGILDNAAARLPADMWRGTDRATAISLIRALPAAPYSRTLRDLQFRLLGNMATAPIGADAGNEFFSARVGRLAAMGESESVGTMVRSLGPQTDESARRIDAESQVLAGDMTNACEAAANFSRSSADPFWRKLQIICLIAAGNNPQAMLDVDLLREKGLKDPGFFALIEYALGTRTGKLPDNISSDALNTALLNAIKRPVAAGSVAKAPPPVLRQMAGNTNLPIAIRLEAAERGEQLGVIDPEQLLKLYQEAANAPGLPAAMKQRAVNVRNVVQAQELAQKVAAIAAAFRSAQSAGLFATMSRVLGPQMVRFYPEQKTAPVGAEAARAALALNDQARAVEWFYTIVGGATIDPQYVAQSDRLWVVMQLADNSNSIPWEPGHLNKWRELDARRGSAHSAQRQAVVAAMLQGLGERYDPAELNPPAIVTGFANPPAGVLDRLALAAEQRRIAEAVSLICIAAGEQPLTLLSPATLHGIISRMRMLGMADAARRFAVEVALAYGM
ncbi:MAG: hypothetical protein ABI439_10020 [Rhodospirillales bacterium]